MALIQWGINVLITSNTERIVANSLLDVNCAEQDLCSMFSLIRFVFVPVDNYSRRQLRAGKKYLQSLENSQCAYAHLIKHMEYILGEKPTDDLCE